MLKHLGPTAKKTLLEIFNLSWRKGLVPEIWKEAHVIPIFKKRKDKTIPGNYHQISLLSCVGKLIERLINCRPTWLLESREVLIPTQTGYCQHRNTEDQLAHLTKRSRTHLK